MVVLYVYKLLNCRLYRAPFTWRVLMDVQLLTLIWHSGMKVKTDFYVSYASCPCRSFQWKCSLYYRQPGLKQDNYFIQQIFRKALNSVNAKIIPNFQLWISTKNSVSKIGISINDFMIYLYFLRWLEYCIRNVEFSQFRLRTNSCLLFH